MIRRAVPAVRPVLNSCSYARRLTSSTRCGGEITATLIEQENIHCAHNYRPLPVVFSRASGARVWDPEGREYLDFLSAYSAVNQGHCHPDIVAAAQEQLVRVTLSSRAFHNDQLPLWARDMTSTFGYDTVLPMNTGAEAVETGLKLARRWGSIVKGVPDGEAVIVSATDCFHGRTLAAISMSTDPTSTDHHAPLAPGFATVPFGDASALRERFATLGDRAVAFLVEPIQGEAGVQIAPDGYLAECFAVCEEHGALMIADEVQTGIARTGKMLAVEHDDVRPHVVLLGKALGGGVYPISAVLADEAVMGTVVPGVHGSTFGGNPLACAVSRAALRVIKDESLATAAERLGDVFAADTAPLVRAGGLIKEERGRGLLRAIELDREVLSVAGVDAMDICMRLKELGVLAKPTRETTIRLAPPLVITDEQLRRGIGAIEQVVREFEESHGLLL